MRSFVGIGRSASIMTVGGTMAWASVTSGVSAAVVA